MGCREVDSGTSTPASVSAASSPRRWSAVDSSFGKTRLSEDGKRDPVSPPHSHPGQHALGDRAQAACTYFYQYSSTGRSAPVMQPGKGMMDPTSMQLPGG